MKGSFTTQRGSQILFTFILCFCFNLDHGSLRYAVFKRREKVCVMSPEEGVPGTGLTKITAA